MAIRATHSVGRADLVGAFDEFDLAGQQGRFIADEVSPVAPVPDQAANFPVITRESGTALESGGKIGTEGKYPVLTFQTKDKAYACEEYGFAIRLADKEVAKLAKTYNIPVDEAAGRIVWHQVKLQREKRVADQLFDPAVFTAGKGNFTDLSAGGTTWATTTNPILAGIQAAQEAVFARTGIIPMDLTINYTNFNRLVRNEKIAGMLSTAKDRTVQAIADALAPLLGLGRIHVGYGIYNSTPGFGAFMGQQIWSSLYALIHVNQPDTKLPTPRLAVSPLWTNDSPQVVVLEEYRDEDTRADKMRARQTIDELLCDDAFGQLLQVAP